MSRQVAPSLLAADFANLRHDIEMINTSEADWLHCDIMDGVFVPNISFGIPVVKAVKKYSLKPLDVHLMITNPDQFIEPFHRAGADNITIHMEACGDPLSTVRKISSLGIKAGVSLKPDTPVCTLEKILPFIDLVLIMSVNPGFGGQEFIPSTYDKVKKTRALIDKTGAKTLIEVDGGIDLSNAGNLYQAGVDILVTGTTVFRSANPVQTIANLKRAGL
jgi:ribulose-phosphate 3-epimerase